MKKLKGSGFLIYCAFAVSLAPAILAQPTGHPAAVIREGVNEARLIALEGNTRPEANAQNDRGIVDDSFQLDHMLLQLKRSPEREAALKQYIDELHDANSPNFHQWLTAAQFAEYYGVAQRGRNNQQTAPRSP